MQLSDILAPSVSNKEDQCRFDRGGLGIEKVLVEFEDNIKNVLRAISK